MMMPSSESDGIQYNALKHHFRGKEYDNQVSAGQEPDQPQGEQNRAHDHISNRWRHQNGSASLPTWAKARCGGRRASEVTRLRDRAIAPTMAINSKTPESSRATRCRVITAAPIAMVLPTGSEAVESVSLPPPVSSPFSTDCAANSRIRPAIIAIRINPTSTARNGSRVRRS